MNDLNKFEPDWSSPPGDTIEDLLKDFGWSRQVFAKKMGVTKKFVNELIIGEKPIDTRIAYKLSDVLGYTADFWLKRDDLYRERLDG